MRHLRSCRADWVGRHGGLGMGSSPPSQPTQSVRLDLNGRMSPIFFSSTCWKSHSHTVSQASHRGRIFLRLIMIWQYEQNYVGVIYKYSVFFCTNFNYLFLHNNNTQASKAFVSLTHTVYTLQASHRWRIFLRLIMMNDTTMGTKLRGHNMNMIFCTNNLD